MNIVVKSITDLNIPQPCHGKNLARLARVFYQSTSPNDRFRRRENDHLRLSSGMVSAAGGGIWR